MIDPSASDTLPLRGSAVDTDSGYAIGEECVMLALQTVLVLHDIGVPGVCGLDI